MLHGKEREFKGKISKGRDLSKEIIKSTILVHQEAIAKGNEQTGDAKGNQYERKGKDVLEEITKGNTAKEKERGAERNKRKKVDRERKV